MATTAAAATAATLSASFALGGLPLPAREEGAQASLGKPQKDLDERWSYAGRSKVLAARAAAVKAAVAAHKGKTREARVSRHCDVLVVGGGTAGLSAAACLKHQGVHDVMVVEANERLGDVWRSRYHRLHLHDVIEGVNLPLEPHADSCPTYLSREYFAAYIDDYSKHCDLKCLTQHSVVQLAPNETETETEKGRDHGWMALVVNHADLNEPQCIQFVAKHVVVATGFEGSMHIPAFPGLSSFGGLVIHTSRYTNGTDLGLAGKRVLVVGFGNSGAEILVDLHEHGANPTALVRSPVTVIPRAYHRRINELGYRHPYLFWVPFLGLALIPLFLVLDASFALGIRFKWGWEPERRGLRLRGMPPLTSMFYKLMVENQLRVYVIDMGAMDLILQGHVAVTSGDIDHFVPGGVVLRSKVSGEANQVTPFDAVVMATGFTPADANPFLDSRLRPNFKAVDFFTNNVVESKALGLWFIHGRVQAVRDNGPFLARQIARRLGLRGDGVAGIGGDSFARILLHVATVTAAAIYYFAGRRSTVRRTSLA